jgi:hypothetical protein
VQSRGGSYDDFDFVRRQFAGLVNQFIDLRIGRIDLTLEILFWRARFLAVASCLCNASIRSTNDTIRSCRSRAGSASRKII